MTGRDANSRPVAGADLDVVVERIGALPIVNRLLDRLRVDALLAENLPADPRCALEPATVLGVLVRNLVLAREPLYALSQWAAGYLPTLLGLDEGQAPLLGDDRAGRALEALFDADRASMLTALTLHVIGEFGLQAAELHNDSTSIKLTGAYRAATGRSRAGTRAPAAALGHSKDHRPDLKQLVWILTVCSDGAVPVCYRLADGNTPDDPTHIPTWERLRGLVGSPQFLYVADCKLANRDAMDHIDHAGGRFLTVLPRSRAEDAAFRAWIVTHDPRWQQISRRPGRRIGDPDEIWWAAPAPTPSAEGYRILWLRSTAGIARDAATRTQRLRDAVTALTDLAARLASPRCRISTRAAAEAAAADTLEHTAADRWIHPTITEQTTERFRQARRGRPGPDTAYRRTTTSRFTLSWTIDDARVHADAASDGCWPLITNDRQRTDAELFAAYRYQPNLECRHRLLKNTLAVAPVYLKSEFRIDALGFCYYLALLVHALLERELRRAMTTAGVRTLPLYPEDRASAAPTAARVLDTFADLQQTHITAGGRIIKTIPAQLTPVQRQILGLLGVPAHAYTRLN